MTDKAKERASLPVEAGSNGQADHCSICNQTEEWHKEHQPKHAFQAEGGRIEAAIYEQPGQPKPSRIPFDPVLRMALINKGVLTVDDITEAEQQLRAASVLGQGVVVSEPTTEEPTPAQDWVR